MDIGIPRAGLEFSGLRSLIRRDVFLSKQGLKKFLKISLFCHKMRALATLVLKLLHFSHKGAHAMAKDETRRLKPSVLSFDRDSVTALQTINGYAPANSGFTLTALNGLKADLDAAQAAETHALALAATARDEANAKEWAFHNAVIGMRDQVIAQYGRDSNEAQAVGRKKASERKRPGRTSKKNKAS
jgi:hypothetical protein